MFEEYCEEYRKKNCELMEYLNEFLIEFMGAMRRRRDAPYLTGPGHPAAAASGPPAPLSACLFGRATVPKPATLVLYHTQFLLPARHCLTNLNLSCLIVILLLRTLTP